MEPIRTFIEREKTPAPDVLPAELRRLYGGDLRFPEAPPGRPYLIGNFVATLDGVVSFKIPGKSGGGEISGHDDGDRFVMALLRASVDAVMIASGTVEATARDHLWIPDSVSPIGADLFAAYRRSELGKAKMPMTVLVTSSGAVDLDRAVFRTDGVKVLILTTDQGKERLKRSGVERLTTTEVHAMAAGGSRIDAGSILTLLRTQYGVQRVLHEGGPTLFGQFVAARLVDELFLTLAPQIAGRSQQEPRPALIEGVSFLPKAAPWLRIESVKGKHDHLYLRYEETKREARVTGQDLASAGEAKPLNTL